MGIRWIGGVGSKGPVEQADRCLCTGGYLGAVAL